jgi:N-acetylglucosamine-6-phosphate deacetylase
MMEGIILTQQGFVDGAITVDKEGRIAAIEGERIGFEMRAADARTLGRPMILPGFIDTHVHGGGGRDTMEGGDALDAIGRVHVAHGTTSFLATTMTAPPEDLDTAFAGIRAAMTAQAAGPVARARMLGVHLEGPYINAAMLGAQPDFARALSLDELSRLNSVAPIRLITLAPEAGSNMAMIHTLVEHGYVVQIGHTAGTYEDGLAAMDRGARGFTHLYNAMTGMHHRKPGMVGAALAHAEFAEIIPDLLHVHPGAIRAALRAVPKLFCVTDSTAAAGMPDGEYRLGRHTVTKCMGGVRLADGTLAGSTLTMDQALRNLVHDLGLGIADAARRVSTNAADYLGITDRGRLAAGAWADFVVLSPTLELLEVHVEGHRVHH